MGCDMKAALVLLLALVGVGACDRPTGQEPPPQAVNGQNEAEPATVPASAPAGVAAWDPGGYAIPYVTVIETPEGKDLRVKCRETLASIRFVWIPAGVVDMPVVGEDGRIDSGRRQVVPIAGFWMSQTEVPWEFYDIYLRSQDLTPEELMKVMDAESGIEPAARSRPSLPFSQMDRGFGHEGYPVICVHHHAARMYCQWLSSLAGRKYRLPSEAEWEYACRSGLPGTGLALEELRQQAWFAENSADEFGEEMTHPVGQKQPNGFGLHDMFGNAGEWVLGVDGQCVLKGGWFGSRAADLQHSFRAAFRAEWQARDPQDPRSAWWLSDGPHAGFRVVRED